MSTDLPLVTILTPTYNQAAFLEETIRSVLDQDYPRLDYLVLDDGSTDGTAAVLDRYAGKLRRERHANRGETRTVNRGFGMARGEIVGVVNSDDPLLPGAVRAAVEALAADPRALAAYPDWREIGAHGEKIRDVFLPDYDLFHLVTQFECGIGPGAFLRRAAIERIGGRDESFVYAGDLDYWYRLARIGGLTHVPRILATHRTHPNAASTTGRGGRLAGELIRVLEKVYADPALPSELRVRRREVFGWAHHVASLHCGPDRAAQWKHRLASYRAPGIAGSPRRILSAMRVTAAGLFHCMWRVVRPALRRQFGTREECSGVLRCGGDAARAPAGPLGAVLVAVLRRGWALAGRVQREGVASIEADARDPVEAAAAYLASRITDRPIAMRAVAPPAARGWPDRILAWVLTREVRVIAVEPGVREDLARRLGVQALRAQSPAGAAVPCASSTAPDADR